MSVSIFDLTGRRALITGASRGIGFGIAKALGNAGAHILLNGRDRDRLDDAAAKLQSEGISVTATVFDITKGPAVTSAVDDLVATAGSIDILVNNAGIQNRNPLHEFSESGQTMLLATAGGCELGSPYRQTYIDDDGSTHTKTIQRPAVFWQILPGVGGHRLDKQAAAARAATHRRLAD